MASWPAGRGRPAVAKGKRANQSFSLAADPDAAAADDGCALSGEKGGRHTGWSFGGRVAGKWEHSATLAWHPEEQEVQQAERTEGKKLSGGQSVVAPSVAAFVGL